MSKSGKALDTVRPDRRLAPRPAVIRRPAFGSRFVTIRDSARLNGIHMVAGRGSGKSRFLGRLLANQDMLRGVPTVIFDAVGATINNLLDTLARRPVPEQLYYFPRVRYVDMSGCSGRVVPWPLYYRQNERESLYSVSQRYLDTIKRLDPHLVKASVQGWNALWSTGTEMATILAALGYQITEATSLLDSPRSWYSRFDEVLRRYPDDAYEAVRFFRQEYVEWATERRATHSAALRVKLAQLTHDPTTRAMFGASRRGIDWSEVVENRLCILLDFSRETSAELRAFKMNWVFVSLLSYILSRGHGRHRPISLIVDELAGMYKAGSESFAQEMEELINVIARNYSVWLTLAHQELFQFDEHTQAVLMSMGTQIIGNTQDHAAALRLAQRFYEYDPYAVKRYENVWGTGHPAKGVAVPTVLEERPVEFTIDEQALLHSRAFLTQRPFHFLVKVSRGEGDATGALRPMSIEHLDDGIWVREEGVARVKEALSRRDGRPVADVLQEIRDRQSTEPARLATSNDVPPPPAAREGLEDEDEDIG